ncbi:GNAT family N-acetyltransferase [Paenibacillus macerans]|uniref:GNAT family N-acetyltransferase n=1 Tax=Paenibacillus macerans TaxID=44252 RepID=UPI00203F2C23|nr:GNAT family N-acetyltransferase [Paenibacillus macerans]MCM3698440.1 GNAT family N-acetyltransferase [Paenibacillus macerans]
MIEQQFEQVYAIMTASFPEIERRTYAGQKELLSNPYYRLITEPDASKRLVAFLAVWEFPLFRFVEHLAVDPSVRGGGLGKKLMAAYLEKTQAPVILEVEPPVADLAKRRVDFYKRLGFHLQPFDYVQPPLQRSQPDLPLKIMSYPGPLTEAEFARYKEILYTEVYKVSPRM